jgi:putative addiction module component (TIGR02574 family)
MSKSKDQNVRDAFALKDSALRMPANIRLKLAGDLWDSLRDDEIPLSRTMRTELRKRLARYRADPNTGMTLEEFKQTPAWPLNGMKHNLPALARI